MPPKVWTRFCRSGPPTGGENDFCLHPHLAHAHCTVDGSVMSSGSFPVVCHPERGRVELARQAQVEGPCASKSSRIIPASTLLVQVATVAALCGFDFYRM